MLFCTVMHHWAFDITIITLLHIWSVWIFPSFFPSNVWSIRWLLHFTYQIWSIFRQIWASSGKQHGFEELVVEIVSLAGRLAIKKLYPVSESYKTHFLRIMPLFFNISVLHATKYPGVKYIYIEELIVLLWTHNFPPIVRIVGSSAVCMSSYCPHFLPSNNKHTVGKTHFIIKVYLSALPINGMSSARFIPIPILNILNHNKNEKCTCKPQTMQQNLSGYSKMGNLDGVTE